MPGHNRNTIGPLAQVNAGNEACHIKDASAAQGGKNQGNSEEAGIGKSGSKFGDCVLPETQFSHKNAHQHQQETEGSTDC